MKHGKNTISSALGALDGAGLGTAARRIVCELRALKPRAKKSAAHDAKAVGAIGPEMSAIVCTLGKSEKLISAVRSLENQTLPRGEYEIIVVSSGGRLDAELEKKLGGARIITVPEAGLSRARNAGAAVAGGMYLTYIDDDAIAAPDLLESVRGAFRAHKNAGVIGGQVLLREPPRDIVLSGHEDLWSEFRIPGKKYREAKFQYDFPFGADFSVLHAFLDEAGGFDLRYGRVGHDYAGGEETALCFKALSLGYRIGLEPKCRVLHDVDESRFTREHVARTIEAGIMTARRLFEDGYSRSDWDLSYALERVSIAEREIKRLRKRGAEELEIFYKECERNGFEKLARVIEKRQNSKIE